MCDTKKPVKQKFGWSLPHNRHWVNAVKQNDWVSKLNQLSKHRLYKNMKQNYNMGNYLSMNISKSHRSLLAQFRCGILPIRIETGR